MFYFKGGLAFNIVPPEFKATFDIRITPRTTIQDFQTLFQSWIAEAEGEDADSGRILVEFSPVF